MIQTILEYKDANKLTWLQLAQRFGSDHYQKGQEWHKQGWKVITEDAGEFLVSVRRERVK